MALRELNQEWDKAVGLIGKYALRGAFAGTLIGLFFFKRKIPVIGYFSGLGIGCGIVESEKNFNKMYQSPKNTSQ